MPRRPNIYQKRLKNQEEEKENSPEPMDQSELIDFDDDDSDESLEEIDRKQSKKDKDYLPSQKSTRPRAKRPYANHHTYQHSSFDSDVPMTSSAMSENVNILNFNQANHEPIAKKKCPSPDKTAYPISEQELSPVFSFFYTYQLVQLEFVNRFFDQNELYSKIEAYKTHHLKSTRLNLEETLVKFRTKSEKEENLFYVGQYEINALMLNDLNYEKLEPNGSYVNYIYETTIQYSPERDHLDGFRVHSNSWKNFNPLKRYPNSIEIFNREYYIMLSLSAESESSDLTNTFMFKFEPNEINAASIRLSGSKHTKVIIDSMKIHKDNKRIQFNLTIYLTDKLRLDEAISDNPSFNYLSSKHTMDMQYIISHFYFSRKTNLVLNNKLLLTNKDYDFEDDRIDNDLADEKTSSTRNENLFDLVYDLHQNTGSYDEIICCKDDSIIQNASFLRPSLRTYQINAIKWMLYKENFCFGKKLNSQQTTDQLHPLYTKLVNDKGEYMYYHKYFGVATEKMPLKKKSLPGGILADEMGLGKTLEILSLIMINPRPKDYVSNKFEIKVDVKKKELNKKSFSCLCGNTPNSFRADSYNKKNVNDENIYQCKGCAVWSHVRCLNYQGRREEFLCLECCTKVPPISSGCTLIVTPSIISHQWADEINKHLSKKLKVLVYTGTHNGFVQPKDLAALDICITTYDVLSNELSHVFAIENMRVLRKAKRFMNIPSPLICVEWWRICLDEAQMVHSTNSRCAEMANRLSAINRWCVTGTPIGRSLGDLHGLFAFIREDPYTEKKWFKFALFETFKSGDKMPMAQAVSSVLWRTAKKYVEDQINIPKQTEKTYWLDFSPFESHLYKRVLEVFKQNRKNSFKESNENNQNNNAVATVDDNNNNQTEESKVDNFFSKYSNRNLRIDEIDRTLIDQILAPLVDLRLSCNHPQLVLRKKSFMAQNAHANKKEKLLTMEKSLQILMKKTQNECDNIFRLMTMHSNALAGLHIIKKENDKAVELYQKVLDSEKEFDSNIKLDLVQKVHTLHNYISILESQLSKMPKVSSADLDSKENLELQIQLMSRQLQDCESAYKISFEEKKIASEDLFKKKNNELTKSLSKKGDNYLGSWSDALDKIENSSKAKEFWQKLSTEFQIASINYVKRDESSVMKYELDDLDNEDDYITEVSYTVCGKAVKSFTELKYVFVTEYDKIIRNRKDLNEKLETFYKGKITYKLVEEIADCHLRKNMTTTNKSQSKNLNKSKCELCTSDSAFDAYAVHLFTNLKDALKLIIKSGKHGEEDSSSEAEEDQFQNQQIQTKTRSDLEKFLKLIIAFGKNEPGLHEYLNNGREFLDFYASLKEEFKLSRQFWTDVSNLINAMDELEMVKLRLRLLHPGEKNPNKLEYLIQPGTLDTHFYKHKADQKECRINLGKKLGQLLFLKNSLKTFNLEENQENQEPCPICQCNLGYEWYILSCGHLYCKDCYFALLKQEPDPYNQMPISIANKRAVRCALCREVCAHNESHLVSTINQNNSKDKAKTSKNDSNSFDDEASLSQRATLNELSNIKIKGNCNSAKVEGIVKCLIKILRQDSEAKCLIFSEHVTMLELIIDLLKDNLIAYNFVKENYSLQKKIDEFKKNQNINVLLMPYSLGANGLNIIEATHVILAEPTLNKSQEVQAIGRVHRIGQTKPTFVYRFMIKDTIEEHVYNMFKSSTSYSNNQQIDYSKPMCSKDISNQDQKQNSSNNVLTLNDIKNLFLNL